MKTNSPVLYRWQDLTVDDFADAVAASKGVCVVPLGCLEKHGHQLPLATDSLVAVEVSERAARKEPVVLFPFSPFGHIVEVKHMLGTVALRTETLLNVLRDLCGELARNGLPKIIFYNCHGGNNGVLNLFLRECLEERRPYTAYQLFSARFPEAQQAELLRRIGRDALPECGHADFKETAMLMAMSPEKVRMDRVDVPETHRLDRLAAFRELGLGTSVDWYADYPNQIAGDPSIATPELGEWLLDTSAEQLAKAIRLVKDDAVTPALLQEYYAKSDNPIR